MYKLLEVPRRNFARARLTISLARSSPTKGVILVYFLYINFVRTFAVEVFTRTTPPLSRCCCVSPVLYPPIALFLFYARI